MTPGNARQMRNSNLAKLAAIILVLAGVSAFLLSQAESIVLRATDSLPVSASASEMPTGESLVYIMSAGEEAQVFECEDVKTDLVIRLRTKTGVTGYVAGGNYVLLRRKASPYAAVISCDRVTFSCRGMFETRSHFIK